MPLPIPVTPTYSQPEPLTLESRGPSLMHASSILGCVKRTCKSILLRSTPCLGLCVARLSDTSFCAVRLYEYISVREDFRCFISSCVINSGHAPPRRINSASPPNRSCLQGRAPKRIVICGKSKQKAQAVRRSAPYLESLSSLPESCGTETLTNWEPQSCGRSSWRAYEHYSTLVLMCLSGGREAT